MTRADEAVALFKEGFSCSQAVLTACGGGRGIPRETLLRLGTGFGGGMARMGLTCGAATGAVMALGLAHGKNQASDDEAREKTYALIQRFMEQFNALHGGMDCRTLLGYDLGTPEGRLEAKQSGRVDAFCPTLVRSAVEILEGML
jgi:C_GCAxxG_C_C family probable redox protein